MADPRQRLNGQKRVTASLEEVVVSTDASTAKQLCPDVGQGLFDRSAGWHEGAVDRRQCLLGSGRAWRSIFPFGVSGRASRNTNAEGTMYSGRRPESHRRKSLGATGVVCVSWSNIRDQARFAGGIWSGHDNGFTHRRVPRQRGLDLAELDAKSADLDLVIDSPQAFERPVGPPSSEVAGAVESSAWRASERIGDEPLGRKARAIPIAASKPAPPMYSSPTIPTGPDEDAYRGRRNACCRWSLPIEIGVSPASTRQADDQIVVSVGP